MKKLKVDFLSLSYFHIQPFYTEVSKCSEPIDTTAKVVRLKLYPTRPFYNIIIIVDTVVTWRERLEPLDDSVHLNISADDHLPAGAENPWTTWNTFNRLRTQVGRSRVNMLKWGFSNDPETCDCGIRQITDDDNYIVKLKTQKCSGDGGGGGDDGDDDDDDDDDGGGGGGGVSGGVSGGGGVGGGGGGGDDRGGENDLHVHNTNLFYLSLGHKTKSEMC